MSPSSAKSKTGGRTTPKNKNKELEVTSVSEWRSPTKTGQIIELPSGNRARVKRTMDLMELLKAGKIPNPLNSIVEEMIAQGKADLSNEEIGADAVIQMIDFIDDNVVRAMVDPKCERPPAPKENETADEYSARLIEWEPPSGKLSVNDIDLDDRMFIFAFSQGLASDLESFRRAQGAVMAPISTGKELSVPSQPNS